MKHLADVGDYFEVLLASQHFHVLLVEGPPGWGKTSLIRDILGRLQLPYQLVGSFVTPLALFNELVRSPSVATLPAPVAALTEGSACYFT